MEMDQLIKQVGWLDEERRKDKTKISSLEERLASFENTLPLISAQVKDLSAETIRLNNLLSRIDSFDEALDQMRMDIKIQLEAYDKSTKKREEEDEKIHIADMHSIETSIAEIRKELEPISELRRNLRAREEEEIRLNRVIEELRAKFEGTLREDEETTRSIKLMDDGRRQDSRKITDLTGEVSSMRKRLDEQSSRQELSSASIKRIETRLNELNTVELERRTAISNLIDSQNLREVERERIWKEWQARFQAIESQATDIESTLQNLDETNRSVKSSQKVLDEVSQKMERRLTEISEMQRLTEDRFRQEWATFKVDDQKRWTNYTLTTEEQRNELQRQNDKLAEKITSLEDTMQEIQDLIQQMNTHTEKTLHSILSLMHESVTTFERTIGRAR